MPVDAAQEGVVNTTAAPVQPRRPRDVVRAYVALTKPRIIELLLVTTIPAMLLAERGVPSLWVVLGTLVGGTMAAGSANALNCYLDRDIDAVMRRTVARPLARHAVSPRSALIFGVVLGVVAIATMWAFTGWLPAAMTHCSKRTSFAPSGPVTSSSLGDTKRPAPCSTRTLRCLAMPPRPLVSWPTTLSL